MTGTNIMPDCTDGNSHNWVATGVIEGGLIKSDTDGQWHRYTHCSNCKIQRTEIYEYGSIIDTEYE